MRKAPKISKIPVLFCALINLYNCYRFCFQITIILPKTKRASSMYYAAATTRWSFIRRQIRMTSMVAQALSARFTT